MASLIKPDFLTDMLRPVGAGGYYNRGSKLCIMDYIHLNLMLTINTDNQFYCTKTTKRLFLNSRVV